jgi:hypothetical protein
MILPVCSLGQSDSAILDNAIELLYLTGRSLPHVMMMLIPEAWDGNESMKKYKKDFYEYHAAMMEPWDGPASISFTDGKMIGATLDRNGLRPSRYWVTSDDHVIMASEAGVLDLDPATIVSKGRLQPGKMFVVDMEQGRIMPDEELKEKICQQQPYGEWLLNNKKTRLEYQKKYNQKYYKENKNFILEYAKEKQKDYRKTNPLYRIKSNLRRRMNRYLKFKSKSTEEILGISYKEFIIFLENKFTEGMTIEKLGKEIHIDHIIPLSSANNEEELYKLCHYTNLQPLWAKDNLEKSNKLNYICRTDTVEEVLNSINNGK